MIRFLRVFPASPALRRRAATTPAVPGSSRRRYMAVVLMAASLIATHIQPVLAGAAEGMAAWRQGDFGRALLEWEPLAVRGDPAAQFNLGLMYEKGQGVTRDTTRAALWYRKSADQGFAEAQNNLGRLYYAGDGVPENYPEAVAQFHRAAEQGVAFSHFFLGMIFAAGGNGVEADPVQAYKWLTLAAALHTAPRYREDALSSRKPVADGMSASQIAVAEQLALNWMNDFRRRTER